MSQSEYNKILASKRRIERRRRSVRNERIIWTIWVLSVPVIVTGVLAHFTGV